MNSLGPKWRKCFEDTRRFISGIFVRWWFVLTEAWRLEQYAGYARLGFGMPHLKTYQDYLRTPPSLENSENLFKLIYKALRRLYKTRVLYFFRIWTITNYSLGFKVFLTYALIQSSVDLLITLVFYIAYYVMCYNVISTLLAPLTITLFIGVFYRLDTILPLSIWCLVLGFKLCDCIVCMVVPMYMKWLHFNLTFVAVSRLAGRPPGKHAWMYLALFFGYLLFRALDDFVAIELAFRKTELLFANGTLVNMEFHEVLTQMKNQIRAFHVVLEQNLADLFIHLKSGFLHSISKWK